MISLPRSVRFKNLPRWYGLSYQPKGRHSPQAIVFLITEKCARVIEPLLKITRIKDRYIDYFGGLFYETDLHTGFGFFSCVQFDGVEDGFVRLVMPIEEGTSPWMLAATYSILFSTLDFPSEEILKAGDRGRTQLLTITSHVQFEERLMNNAPMGGEMSPKLANWISKRGTTPTHLVDVEEAMAKVWNTFAPRKIKKEKRGPHPYPGFSVFVQKGGGLIVECPGNACDVSTLDWWEDKKGWGHKLGCHNLDSAIQQITILAGYAKIHDLAAKDLG